LSIQVGYFPSLLLDLEQAPNPIYLQIMLLQFLLPDQFVSTGKGDIALWYSDEQNITPSLDKIQQELNDFMLNAAEVYMNFSAFPNLEIEKGNPSFNSSVEDRKVTFTINYPLTIKKDEKTIKLNVPYKLTYDVRLGELYKVASELNQDPSKAPTLADEWKVNITLLEAPNFTIYLLTDNMPEYKFENKTFNFMFARAGE